MSFAVRQVDGMTLPLNPHDFSNVLHLIELADRLHDLLHFSIPPDFE